MNTKRCLMPILICLLLVVFFMLAAVPATEGAVDVLQEPDFQPVPQAPSAFAPSYRGIESNHAAASTVDNLNVSLLGQIGGVAYAVDVQESYAYYGEGCQLVIFDISDSSNPEIISITEPMAGLVRDIQVVDGYVYVAAGDLYVYDVSNPVSPTLVGLFEPFGATSALDISGSNAYINDSGFGLRILDISNPESPGYVATALTGLWIHDIVEAGGFVYAATEIGLDIVDVSFPYAPSWASHYENTESTGVAVEGEYAYLRDWTGYVDIIDVSNPASPTHVSAINMRYSGALLVIDQTAYLGDAERLHIVDVSDSLAPSELGVITLPGTRISDIALAGHHAFISDYYGGLQIVDITDSSVPVLAATYDRPGFVNGMVMRDDHVYIASGWEGLNIIDVSSPETMELVGAWGAETYVRNVAFSANFAFVAGSSDGLHAVDISNPSMPSTISILDLYSSVRDVAIDGHYAFVATSSGLHVVDIANPSSMQKVGFLEISGDALGIAVVGSYAYIAAEDSGLQIIDVNQPEVPAARGVLDTPGSAQDIAVSEGYAYIADKDGGVRIIDVSNPNQPVERSSFKQSGTFSAIHGIAVAGKHLYAAGLAGLSVLDVVDPSAPLEVGSYDVPYSAESVAVANGIAYVGTSVDGIYTLRYTGPGSITIKKQAGAADGTSFNFSGDLGSFALQAGASEVFPAVSSGDYDIVETLTLGWYLHEVSCDSEEVSQIENGVTIHLPIAADITCTFDNRPLSLKADAGGPYTGSEGSPVALDASGSSPIEMIKTYKWDCTNDGTWDVTTHNPQGSSCTYDDNGSYTLRLRIWDNTGQPATDDTTVTISNVPPLVDAGQDQAAVAGAAVQFAGSFNDPGAADSHTIKWDFGDGITKSGTLTPMHAYSAPGQYTVALTVTDDDGGSDSDQLTVDVKSSAPALSDVAANPPAIDEGGSILLMGTMFDEGLDSALTLEITWGDGLSTTREFAAGITTFALEHTYVDDDPSGTPADTLIINLKLIDDQGAFTTTTTTVQVSNRPPTVDAGPDRKAIMGQSESFTVVVTDPGTADTHTVSWDFGDGSPPIAGETVTHAYEAVGSYTATVTVIDDDGGTGTDTISVAVVEIHTICVPLILAP